MALLRNLLKRTLRPFFHGILLTPRDHKEEIMEILTDLRKEASNLESSLDVSEEN